MSELRFSLQEVTVVYRALPVEQQVAIDTRAREAAERVCFEKNWKRVDLNDWSRAQSKRYAHRLADSSALARERMKAFHEIVEAEVDVGEQLQELERRRESA